MATQTASESTNTMSSKQAGKQPSKDGDKPSKGSKQDAGTPKKTGRKHNQDLPGALPDDFDIASIPISAAELCAYFPNHSKWWQYCCRLLRNNWASKDITKAQLHARGTLTKESLTRRWDAIRQQISTGGKIHYDDDEWKYTTWKASISDGGHSDGQKFSGPERTGSYIDLYDPALGEPDVWEPPHGTASKDATLAQLVDGVINHPQGQDAGALTHLLQYGIAQGEPWLKAHTVSQLTQLIEQLGLGWPTEATTTDSWDQEVLRRLPPNP